MPHDSAALQTEIMRGATALHTPRAERQDAVARSAQPSLIITPTFLELAWQHPGRSGEEPWFVVVRQLGALVGLLPLGRTRQRYVGQPFQTLMHLGVPVGERPGVLHLIEADRV